MNTPEKPTDVGTAMPPGHSDELHWVQTGSFRWQLRTSVCADSIAGLLQNPDAFLTNPAMHFKNSRVVTVARVPAFSSHMPGLVLRRLNYGKFRHRLRDAFRASRARRALLHGLMLEKAGIATARPWAAAERRVWRWPLSAFLLTEEICNATTLAKLVAKNRWPFRIVVHRLADLIARLHGQGFSHRDLKATNILFDLALKPFLIDLDGIRYCRKIGEARAVADLAVLAQGTLLMRHSSPLSGWRFLKKYCALRLMQGSERRLGAAIAAALEGK